MNSLMTRLQEKVDALEKERDEWRKRYDICTVAKERVEAERDSLLVRVEQMREILVPVARLLKECKEMRDYLKNQGGDAPLHEGWDAVIEPVEKRIEALRLYDLAKVPKPYDEIHSDN